MMSPLEVPTCEANIGQLGRTGRCFPVGLVRLAANPRTQDNGGNAACAFTIFHSVLDQSLVGT